jgi:hypothetical protein
VSSTLNIDTFTLAGGSAETITGLVANPATLIKAPSTNTSAVEIGVGNFTAGRGYPLDPGEFVSTEAINPQTLRVRGVAGQKLSFWQEVP